MTPEQKATAARLADDPRCLAFGHEKGTVIYKPDELRAWVSEVRAFLRTLAAQPDDAAAGQSEVTRQYAEEILGNPSYRDLKVQRLAAEILGRLP